MHLHREEQRKVKHYFAIRGTDILVCVLLLTLSGLTLYGQTTAAVIRTQTDSAAEAVVDPNKYLVGPEDLLFVKVWREPDFTLPVAVRPDGKITMPLIGEVQAAGETPLQLTKTLAELLAQYLNNPEVNVFVTEVRSKKYYINGEVQRTGSFPLVTPTRILEALSHAGGFRDFANTKKIRILRGEKVYYFNYREVTNGKRLEQNIFLESGDQIIIR